MTQDSLVADYADATDAQERFRQAMFQQADRRVRALRQLHAKKLSYAKVGVLVGLSAARVGQLVRGVQS
jgi:hypothetical protein